MSEALIELLAHGSPYENGGPFFLPEKPALSFGITRQNIFIIHNVLFV